MENDDVILEISLEILDELGGEGDFGDQDDGGLMFFILFEGEG